jgi:BirA family biotin operon repressor/biotin-[acetyl-CoA-carboxylase] ligase
VGLYLSTVLRPNREAAFLLTIAAGLAVAEGIQAASGLATRVKWPNDINAGGRKLAGILAEAGSSAEDIQHVVLGIGINVAASSYPAHVAERATSLETELGRTVDRGLLMVECLAALARRYHDLQSGQSAGVLQEWRRRAASTFGRAVECETGGPSVRGVAENIDDTGALLVRTANGIHRVISGQVTWI